MKKRRKNNIRLGLLCIGIAVIIGLIFIYFFNPQVDKKVFYTSVIVFDKIGFDLNSTALTFGAVNPGGSSARDINLTNNYDKDVWIKISSNGNISKYLIVSENNFILKKGERKSVSFSVHIPKDAGFGKYDGNVIIVSRRA